MNNYVLFALIATTGTWLVTALGAATVVFFKSQNQKSLNIMLGFASGVMIAASFWSLLQPAIERAEQAAGLPAYLVASTGFLSGALFMWLSDKAVSFARKKTNTTPKKSNEKLQRIIMLVLSITLHNIPEGLAVGVAFGALQSNNYSAENLAGAISVAVGIGLQNFPEGAAVSVPLRREGISRGKSFLFGQLSGMVEPIAGVTGALLVVHVETFLPDFVTVSIIPENIEPSEAIALPLTKPSPNSIKSENSESLILSLIKDFSKLESFVVRRKLSTKGTHDYTSKCYSIIKNGIDALVESDLANTDAGITDLDIKRYLADIKDDTAKMILFCIELYRRRDDAMDVNLAGCKYDLIFIDAAKGQYIKYFDKEV